MQNRTGLEHKDFIEIRPIENIFDAMKVRSIRNKCRLYLTHNRLHIGFFQQIRWYLFTYLMRSRDDLSVYIVSQDEEAIGYGLILRRKTQKWLTGGFISSKRGKGYGRALFNYLIRACFPYEVHLDVLQTNERALALYQSIGFKIYKSQEGINFMKL